MLSCSNIYFSIKGTEILKGVSLEIHAGKTTVLIGPSGCGKTTLLRTLALLNIPSKGSINFLENSFSFPEEKNRNFNFLYPDISVVFQQLFLWPHLTNKRNILLAIEKSGNVTHTFQELIQRLNLELFIDSFPNSSSQGQRQRIAIARSLILNPKFLLLDEITSALDVVQTRKIIDTITYLKSINIGCLFITHSYYIAKNISDYVAYMEDGRIVEFGKPEILDNPRTKELKSFLDNVI